MDTHLCGSFRIDILAEAGIQDHWDVGTDFTQALYQYRSAYPQYGLIDYHQGKFIGHFSDSSVIDLVPENTAACGHWHTPWQYS